jgi:formylmethanofuran dehydrogenase subunit E
VHLDTAKLDGWPTIREWFLKLRPKNRQDRQLLLDEIRAAGDSIFSIRNLKVAASFLRMGPGKSLNICPVCQEAYRTADGPVCPACGGNVLPYCELDLEDPSKSPGTATSPHEEIGSMTSK